ncbi:MAG TPA: tetratricopeptide repeat protein [Candidatus Obscuribacterales bacterium]
MPEPDPNDWDQLTSAGHEAHAAGRIARAEVYFKQALTLAEQFAESDPRRPKAINNLAAVYQIQGKYTFAESLYKRALDLNQRLHGKEHPDVALNLHNLAVLYCAKSRFAEAEPLFREAIAITEGALGAAHASLVSTLRNLAALLRRTGRDEEASVLEERARRIGAGVDSIAPGAGSGSSSSQ